MVTINLNDINDAPTITSTALTTATEDNSYSYTLTATDVDTGDTLTMSAPTLPTWLSFDPVTGVLSGMPTNAEVGNHNVTLRVNDGTVNVDQSFTIMVSNTNDAPTFTSTAITNATEDSSYNYTFTASDPDVGDTLILSAPTLPTWLSFDPATGVLSGTPTNADVGDHSVVLRVNDGTVDVDQSFTITVGNINDAPVVVTNSGLNVPEDATLTITATELQTTDVDNSANEIVYTLTSLPTGGSVQLSGSSLGIGGTFTQDEIDNNLVTYRDADSGETTSFQFTVSDGTWTSGNITFSINGQPMNDAPVVTAPGSALTATEQVS